MMDSPTRSSPRSSVRSVPLPCTSDISCGFITRTYTLFNRYIVEICCTRVDRKVNDVVLKSAGSDTPKELE